ncbi:MAG: glycosyltransferase, partial [Acidimicrobiaceae bacterium]|nr:glycosyltransferase [Acidimicrobiaceae bacterium]
MPQLAQRGVHVLGPQVLSRNHHRELAAPPHLPQVSTGRWRGCQVDKTLGVGLARGRAVHDSHPTIVGVLRPRQADPSAGPEAGAALRAEPPPACVRGNDWRSLPVPPVEEFEPSRSVSVIVPYYEAPEALALTLAGLQLQTYPQELFDVIVVDDGSSTPLHLEAATPLRVKVIHQPDEGFGAARARENGGRGAAGGVLGLRGCVVVPAAGG